MSEYLKPGHCVAAGSATECDPPLCGCPFVRPGEQITWANCNLSSAERLAMRQVAREFPDGAYASFVRMLDAREGDV